MSYLKHILRHLPLLVLVLGSFHPGYAQDPSMQERFVRGNIAYGNGEYAHAADIYREVLAEVQSAEVHYNLGNALAQEERWSEAAFHYLKAHALKPDFEPARANLLLTAQRLELSNEYPKLPDPASLLSNTVWSIIAAVAFWIAVILFLHGGFVAFRIPLSKTVGTCSILVLLTSCVAIFQHEVFRDWAIVSAARTTLRVAPTEQSPGESVVTEGYPVRVLRELAGFYHVMTPDGDEGFILREEVHTLGND